MSLQEYRILSPTAILGYGFPEASFLRGMEQRPHLIAVDAGSTDPGPYYLGSGKPFTDRVGVKSDLRAMLTHGVRNRVPVVIGTAGGSGARSHVDWCREIVEEIAREEGLSFRLGIVYADVEPDTVIEALQAGRVKPLDGIPDLTEEVVRSCPRIVAQMGIEPLQRMCRAGCDVVLAGRCYDPACFSALPTMLGHDVALATHLGKILECAAIAADPGSGSDCVMGILRPDSFVLRTLSPDRRFTAQSTAAHTLYEKSDPYHLPGPGGELDLSGVTFTELGNGEVEVRGTRFVPTNPYAIKLEGATPVGFRTISVAGSHDPVMIENIDTVAAQVKARVDELLAREAVKGQVFFHIYGKNGVMGGLERGSHGVPHELGIVMEVLAPTQAEANTICSITRSTFLHYGYAGRISTAGNLAFPFSPSDVPMGAAYEFSIYHLMEVPDPDTMFAGEIIEVDGKAVQA